ncbi:MAG: hypothetical protein EZS28_042556, partial [Streblomastix strix]
MNFWFQIALFYMYKGCSGIRMLDMIVILFGLSGEQMQKRDPVKCHFLLVQLGHGEIAIDALNQAWKMELLWIHPPIPLLPAVLKQI